MQNKYSPITLGDIIFISSYKSKFWHIYPLAYLKASVMGGIILKNYIRLRVIELARYIIKKQDTTVRLVAKKFGISKSTVHKDVTERLQIIDTVLASKVRRILDKNKAERHIRGGLATKVKYKQSKQKAKFTRR